jgi:putative hydrolases of HD superfamily
MPTSLGPAFTRQQLRKKARKQSHALDQFETLLQHTQGKNHAEFDYRFNLEFGRRFTHGELLIKAIRAILNQETERHAEEAEQAT